MPGLSRSLKVIRTDTNRPAIYDFLLVFSSNFVHKITRFRDIRLQKCCDLEIWVRGPSRSLEMSPLDRAHMTSYWRSIVTMALSRVVSEIFIIENYRDREIRVKGQSRSSKVVPFDRLYLVSCQCSIVTLSGQTSWCHWRLVQQRLTLVVVCQLLSPEPRRGLHCNNRHATLRRSERVLTPDQRQVNAGCVWVDENDGNRSRWHWKRVDPNSDPMKNGLRARVNVDLHWRIDNNVVEL